MKADHEQHQAGILQTRLDEIQQSLSRTLEERQMRNEKSSHDMMSRLAELNKTLSDEVSVTTARVPVAVLIDPSY